MSSDTAVTRFPGRLPSVQLCALLLEPLVADSVSRYHVSIFCGLEFAWLLTAKGLILLTVF